MGFEGGFDVLKKSVNLMVNDNWDVTPKDANFVTLPKTRFKTVWANDIREGARRVWSNYFPNRYGLSPETFRRNR